jgi:hypothetical protein
VRVHKELTVIEKQAPQDAETSLDNISKACARGCKKNSEGNKSFRKGYKLHLDVTDTGFPLTAVVTGANVHDSRLAIPMEQLYVIMESSVSKALFVNSLYSKELAIYMRWP